MIDSLRVQILPFDAAGDQLIETPDADPLVWWFGREREATLTLVPIPVPKLALPWTQRLDGLGQPLFKEFGALGGDAAQVGRNRRGGEHQQEGN